MLVVSLLVSFLATAIFMIALRPIAIELRLVDKPGGRKGHTGVIPMVGGAAIYLGTVLGISLLSEFPTEYRYFVVAGSLLVGIGIIDDRFPLDVVVRLAAQIVAVLIMVYGGGQMMLDIGNPLFIGTIETGPLSLVITALIFATVINAFNFIDGIDGLCGGLALMMLVSLLALSGGNEAALGLTGVIAAAIAGFLVFNAPVGRKRPFRAFLGDGGSTFIGFAIVWVTVAVSQGPGREIAPVTGLWLAAMPLFDLFTCFVRRIANGQSPFTPGEDHAHHTLLRAGMSRREALVALLALQMVYCGIGIAGHFGNAHESVMFALWGVAGVSQIWVVRGIGAVYRGLARQTAS